MLALGSPFLSKAKGGVVHAMRLKYTGETEREFPGFGVFGPGYEGEIDDLKAEVLLTTGFFVKPEEDDQ